MSTFIQHTLMMLEDAGLSVQYPDIREVRLDKQGNSNLTMRDSLMQGKRVSIEQNPHLKFMMLFTLLDFYVDTTYPDMEGKGYREKYENLPTHGDFDVILRELFRVAKVIRNALVHNLSSLVISESDISVDYMRGKNHFILKMSREALSDLHTAIVMYIKGDMGKGNYFLGIMRSIYARILAGITHYNDEFGTTLDQPSGTIRIRSRTRYVLLNPSYDSSQNAIRFAVSGYQTRAWEGIDFYIVRDGEQFLIPSEALDENLSIMEINLITDWKYEGRFPQINAP